MPPVIGKFGQWLIAVIGEIVSRGIRELIELQMAARQAEKEVPDDEALRVRARFRDAVARLRANEGGDPGSVSPSPGGGGGASGDLGPSSNG